MYGLVVECIVESIKGKYGEDVWLKVQKDAKIEKDFYDIHEQYSDSIIKIILSSLSKITSKSKNISNTLIVKWRSYIEAKSSNLDYFFCCFLLSKIK
jgi:hypothetical protein